MTEKKNISYSKAQKNKVPKQRLDVLMVEQGLCDTRSRAKALIIAGEVIAGEHRADKVGEKFPESIVLRFKNSHKHYVSRGAYKLKGALEKWPTKTIGHYALDVGASTGGFCQIWLENGVKQVYALDVGHNQLAWSLRQDERIINLEKTHIGKLEIGKLDPKPTLCSVDVSFIALSKVLPMIKPHLSPNSTMFALIKPQFEAGRQHIQKGGIVRDPEVHQQCIDKVSQTALELGFTILGTIESPIKGMDGNIEFLIGLQLKTTKQ